MLNLHELQVFLVAAETENFSEAGRRLSLSQPAVSMQIHALEVQLGVLLFHRSGRHIALTEAGQTLAPLARDLINRAIQVEESVLSMQGQVIGVLRLGCSATTGKYIVPRLAARLHERHPQVQVVCQITRRGPALEMLLQGEVQIAITSLREVHRDIEYRPLLVDPIVLIARRDHRWARQGGAIQPSDLVGEAFVLREEGAGSRTALKEALEWHGLNISQLQTVMVIGNSEAICKAVQEGLGLAFVSCMVAADAIHAGTLAPIDVEGMTINQTIYLARDIARPATCAQSVFWDFAFSPDNEDLRRESGEALAPVG